MNTWTLLKQALTKDSSKIGFWRDVNAAADLFQLLRTRLTHHQRKIADEEFKADQDVRDAVLQRDNLEKIKQP